MLVQAVKSGQALLGPPRRAWRLSLQVAGLTSVAVMRRSGH
jgi:hypothetical protein